MSSSADSLFPRSFTTEYPVALRGEGVYLFDNRGRKLLDAGSAAVPSIGHGVREVLEAVPAAYQLPYVHNSQFQNPASIEFASFLAGKFPGERQHARVHFTAGGSEATETAIKLVRQYWLSRKDEARYKILSRWSDYHGTTLGALAISGNRRRRQPYLPILPEMGHIAACFCYRCPLEMSYPDCHVACADELEKMIEQSDPRTVAAFILEPVVGATSGAVPPEGYLARIREICNRYGILMIADEVLTGGGRTGGKYFAVEHWGVVPDLILLGKGLSAGYSPLGAVVVSELVWRTIAEGTGTLEHGFTYQDHPASVAIAIAVQRYIERHGLIARAARMGEYLATRMEQLRELSIVGDVRGKGMLQTIEFTGGPDRSPLPAELRFVETLYRELLDRGVIVYPIRGTIDGVRGEHIMLAPPFTITEVEVNFLVERIAEAVTELERRAVTAAVRG